MTELGFLLLGLLIGGTVGGFAMAMVAAGNRSARAEREYRRWEP